MPKVNRFDLIWAGIAILFILAGSAGAYYFYTQDQQVRAELDAKNQEIRAIETKIKTYRDMLGRLKQLREAQQLMLGYISNREQQEEFTWELGSLAERSGIKIDRCESVNELKRYAKFPEYQAAQWKLTLHGDYVSLLKFLKALSFTKRAAIVADLNLTAQPPQQNNNGYHHYVLYANMTVDVPFKPTTEKVAQ